MEDLHEIFIMHNPYQQLYRSHDLKTGQNCSRREAQEIARHLGYLHNTFGIVIKDFISLIKYKFPQQQKEVLQQPMDEERNEKESGDGAEELEPEPENIKWREQYKAVEKKLANKKKQINNVLIEPVEIKPIQSKIGVGVVRTNHKEVEEIEILDCFNEAQFEYRPQKANDPPKSRHIQQVTETQKKVMNVVEKQDKMNVIDLEDSD